MEFLKSRLEYLRRPPFVIHGVVLMASFDIITVCCVTQRHNGPPNLILTVFILNFHSGQFSLLYITFVSCDLRMDTKIVQ